MLTIHSSESTLLSATWGALDTRALNSEGAPNTFAAGPLAALATWLQNPQGKHATTVALDPTGCATAIHVEAAS